MMRQQTFLAATAVLCVLGALAVGLIVRLERVLDALVQSREELMPVLDLAGWPGEFVQRVQAASAGRNESLRDLGCLYHANGFRVEAESVWRTLVKTEPQEPRWPYYLAILRERGGDRAQSEQLLAATLRLAPDYASAHLRMAELLFKQARFAEAAEHYRRRGDLLPGDPYAQFGLARIDLESDRESGKARDRLEALVRAPPDFPSALNLLAELCAQTGDEARAAQLRRRGRDAGRFREADDAWLEELDQYCYDPYQLQVLGAIRMQTGRIENSVPFYEKSVRLAPDDGPAHEALGDVYLQLRRLDDARRTLEAGIVASPKTGALYSRLAQVWRAQGRSAEAVAVLARGIVELPSVAELRSDLGVALEALERRDDAVAAYRAAIRLNPSLTEPLLNLGLCLTGLGRNDEAVESLRRVLALHPGHGKALLALAQVELERGDLDVAGGYARRLYALHPEQTDAREILALWHVQSGAAEARAGNLAEAERLFRAGLDVDSGFGELHGNLGVLHAQAGNFAAAVEDFQHFVAIATTEPKAHLYLGQALLGAGRWAEARRTLEQASELARGRHDAETVARCEELLRAAAKPGP